MFVFRLRTGAKQRTGATLEGSKAVRVNTELTCTFDINTSVRQSDVL